MPQQPKIPTFRDVRANVSSRLRVLTPTKGTVPQLTFDPSIGIIARDIDKLGMDIRSFREPLTRAIKQVVIPSIQKNFEMEGRPAWDPYSPDTIKIREQMGSPVNKLLNKTGALQNVMKQVNIWTINTNAAILLDLPRSVSYGKIHQEGYSGAGAGGSTVGKRVGKTSALNMKLKAAMRTGDVVRDFNFSIPPRPFVVLQEQDLNDIQRVFETWLGERIALHWGRK